MGRRLEQWWEQLAQRLTGHALLPELPGEVAQAFTEAWHLALAHAGTAAEAAFAEQQNTLFAEQTSLTQERKLWEIALAAGQTELAESANRLTQSELQLAERQGLIEQLTAQATDMLQQRDRLLRQLEHRQAGLDMLRAEHAAAQAHIRTVEDRARQQVDHARQELKALRQQLEREQRDHDKRNAQVTSQERKLRESLSAAGHMATHEAGRALALEAPIAKWHRDPPPKRATRAASRSTKASTRHRQVR